MQYYKVKIRLGGEISNEVWKIVSAPEFLILQFIHGADALVNAENVKKESIDLGDERERLKTLYDSALSRNGQSVSTLFGPLAALPLELPLETLQRQGLDNEDDLVGKIQSDRQKTMSQNGNKNLPQTQVEEDRMKRVKSAQEVSLDELME